MLTIKLILVALIALVCLMALINVATSNKLRNTNAILNYVRRDNDICRAECERLRKENACMCKIGPDIKIIAAEKPKKYYLEFGDIHVIVEDGVIVGHYTHYVEPTAKLDDVVTRFTANVEKATEILKGAQNTSKPLKKYLEDSINEAVKYLDRAWDGEALE